MESPCNELAEGAHVLLSHLRHRNVQGSKVGRGAAAQGPAAIHGQSLGDEVRVNGCAATVTQRHPSGRSINSSVEARIGPSLNRYCLRVCGVLKKQGSCVGSAGGSCEVHVGPVVDDQAGAPDQVEEDAVSALI